METKGLKLIGKGLFSKVWRLNDSQVLIKSVCHVKECISFEWHNSTGVFPKFERVEWQTYVTEYFEPVKSLKDALSPEHYEIYKQLRSLNVPVTLNTHQKYDLWVKEFKKVKNVKYRNALIEMLDHLTNYGTDIQFEISPRNIAVKKGKLILLDVFFIISQSVEQRKKGKLKYQY